MKIILLVIGKTNKNYLIESIDEYRNRLKHYLSFQLEVIPELKNAKNLSKNLQKEKETDMIFQFLHESDSVILLDEKGKEYRSIEFASFMEKQMNISTKRLVFIIGGPYGFSDRIYARSNGKLSLSKMTFSHQMIRLIFVEQLYRAMTILKGEPYHHE